MAENQSAFGLSLAELTWQQYITWSLQPLTLTCANAIS